MSRRRGGLTPSRATPITAGATAETLKLYRWLLTHKESCRYSLGICEQFLNMPAQSASPVVTGSITNFQNVTGFFPGNVAIEYHDPNWTSRWGAAGTAYMRDLLIDAHAKGAVISIHHHPGNPVTGSLSREGQVSPAEVGAAGYYYDRASTPLASIKTGGAQEAQFLAYLDRLAVFIESLVDAQGRKIPVILRPLHEVNGTWFWWSGTDRAADFVIVWQKMVDYLRTTKGLTNVLYCWNVGNNGDAAVTSFWPGPTYLDIVSVDCYDDRNSTDISLAGAVGFWNGMVSLANTHNKPMSVGEFGYQYNTGVADIWDVKSGKYLETHMRKASMASLWIAPYGPAASNSDALKSSLERMATSQNAMTAAHRF